MQVGIFEDEAYENLYPLTFTRPTYHLKTGTSTILEKILKAVKKERENPIVLFCRKYLEDIVKENTKGSIIVNTVDAVEDEIILINGLLIPGSNFEELLGKLDNTDSAVVKNGRVIAVRLKRRTLEREDVIRSLTSPSKLSKALLRYVEQRMEINDVTLIGYPWELFEVNSNLIASEFTPGEWEGEVDERVTIYGDKNKIYIGRGAFVEAGTVLDAREGPIYIGENTYVQTLSRITGPTYVGRDCIIFGAQLREGCSIGDVCRVGGEIEEAIFHSYSNKRHYGFIGHAYVGEWINLGAGATNSDLKNTYGRIKVTIRSKKHDTGRIFVGCFIGDHAKAAIGTMIYSGKKIGVSAHVYGTVTEDVPSFTAYAKSLGEKPTEIFLDSAIETARRVMKRRKVELTQAYEKMLRAVFKLTQRERREAKVRKGRFRL